ncbi:HAMP domain-containing sensor histidine kinase [Streptomyces sp. NPDC002132]|uniref:sensor histidine kinase n=1 Tax=unclassified Streptomyces TaxID=2593676 RepID=UPI003334A625
MGFQENAAFIELKRFAASATDWAARERKRIRDREQLVGPAPTRGILSVASVRESVAVGDAGSLPASAAAEWAALGARSVHPDKFRVAARDLNEAIDDALSAVRGQLERHGVSLTLELCREPVWVAAAASDLEAIVFNLALNAVKSFERAGEMLGGRAVLVRTHVDGGQAVVDFSDSGPGVDDIDLVEMWRPGVAGRASDSTGLGLTIVRDAVADMRGTQSVDAHGELGGAAFHIRLPLWPDQD